MFEALYIGATGMQAQQTHVDTIANNLANVGTAGFKKARVSFSDLMIREVSRGQVGASGELLDAGILAPAQRLGAGVGVSRVAKMFDQGEIKQTGSAFDVAIQGEGFLEVSLPDGARGFVRGGTLKVGADGALLSTAGHPLRPSISLPANASGLAIAADGKVTCHVAGQSAPIDVGQMELVRFSNPGALQPMGDNLYRATEASGEPVSGVPGEDGLGALAQGYAEGSNVNMVDEMVNLMVAQRAYEASVKVVQASDEMLAMVNALRK